MKRFISTVILGSLFALPLASQAKAVKLILADGDRKLDVEEIQRDLAGAQYHVGNNDGKALLTESPKLRAALRDHMSDINLSQFDSQISGDYVVLEPTSKVAVKALKRLERNNYKSKAEERKDVNTLWANLRVVPQPLKCGDNNLCDYDHIGVYPEQHQAGFKVRHWQYKK